MVAGKYYKLFQWHFHATHAPEERYLYETLSLRFCCSGRESWHWLTQSAPMHQRHCYPVLNLHSLLWWVGFFAWACESYFNFSVAALATLGHGSNSLNMTHTTSPVYCQYCFQVMNHGFGDNEQEICAWVQSPGTQGISLIDCSLAIVRANCQGGVFTMHNVSLQ